MYQKLTATDCLGGINLMHDYEVHTVNNTGQEQQYGVTVLFYSTALYTCVYNVRISVLDMFG